MRQFVATLIIAFTLAFWSCEKPFDRFLIGPENIGYLTDSTQVGQLKEVLIGDSIASYIGGDEFTGNINNIEVFDSEGNKLMVLTPVEALDSTSTVRTIRIIDNRYHTIEGITRSSTFGDLRGQYKISGIQNTLKNIIVSVDEINAYFTIEKTELPSNMRYDINMKIDPVQIPDRAKIKDFFIQWQ